MEKENNSNESEASVKMRYQSLLNSSLLNLNQKQTSEILTVVAVVGVQCKSSHWQMFFKIGVRPVTLLKKDFNTGVLL